MEITPHPSVAESGHGDGRDGAYDREALRLWPAVTAAAHRREAARPALARCVRVTPEEFSTGYWGRRPLLSHAGEIQSGGGKTFDDLLTPAGVDELIGRRGLRTPFLRMARDGRLMDQHRYAGPGGAGARVADQALDERVLGCLADGATLVLQGLHRIWPPLGDFARQLAADLAHPVGVNAYLTPPDQQGFATHYDTHDVFVLQVAGTKRWRIHPPLWPDPLAAQAWHGRTEEVHATARGEPELDAVLEPGDALYLPRGWLHSASAGGGELSMHLTVGVFTVTRYAIAEALLALAADEPELRRSLPVGVDAGDPEQLADEVQATVRALTRRLAGMTPEAVATRLRPAAWSATRPAPIRPLAQAAALDAVDSRTRITPRGQLRWRLDPDGPDRVALQTFDRTIRFPDHCADALRAVLHGEVQRVGELPGLDPADRLVLARRLLAEAVVVPVDP